ncbi:magnesium transporter [Alkalilacustris brevis]|uniref:magnesium transporter n=1 Tax=Alkalilacustris brevis TaxID=2026338 RepID=UPI000E0DD2B6|nr:magnesium transporter [Alkalilacustris brevis]
MNTTTLTRADLALMLREGRKAELARSLRHAHPADVVAMAGDFTRQEMATLLSCLPEDRQAVLFGYFDHETQAGIARALSRKDMARIFDAMAHDERADLFAQLDEDQKQALLPGLAQAERDDLLKLASYEEGTVGAIMTSDYATLPADLTTVEALAHLRRAAPDSETIYHSYVMDEAGRLVGTASLRELLVAPDSALVSEVMRRAPPHLRAEDDRAVAVRMIEKYDLLAVPVINGGDRLVGIVTHDDAFDVARAVDDVSFARVGAVRDVGTSMMRASAGLLYRKRLPWLVILVFGNIFSGAGIAYFEEIIAAYIALVFFLPLLIDSGGNAGSQSATLMVRALATGDVRLRDWSRMLGREVVVAGALGLTMALAVSAIGVFRAGPEIAFVVALTMVLIVLVGSLIGMSMPFLLSRFGMDPATASAPLITSLADAIGVVIYFAMATWLLGLPAAG